MPETLADAAANARRVDADAPWLGLLAFTEETQRFFFGRDAEIREIFLRVRDHPLTVLYGQSGYGKTSLLSAGLIPKLRADRFRPALLRLRFEKDDPPLVEQVRGALAVACGDEATTAADLLGRWGEGTLWECFHHPALRVPRLESAPPVLIFDQFEEIFTLGATQRPRAELETLARELADLVENRPPNSVQARLTEDLDLASELDFAPSPLRLIITLREDYLSHFEAWKGAMPSLMRNRMALNLLRGPQASEAVVRPGRLEGRNLVSDEVGAQIVRVIARRAPATPLEEIEAVPPLLSLLCDELNRARGNTPFITAELVEERHGNILQEFYARCFEGFPPDVRHFIEERLVTVGGHRNLAAREDAEAELTRAGVPNPSNVLDTLIARRLLSAEERGGTQRIEITHDVLAPLVAESRDKRQQRERAQSEAENQLEQERIARSARETRRLRRFTLVAVTAAILAIGGMAVGVFAMKRANMQRTVAELQSRAATKAGLYADHQRHLAEEEAKKRSVMLVEAARSDAFVADDRFSKGEKPAALAYLARSIAYDPQSMLAAEKAVAALNTWDFALPSVFLEGHSGEVRCAAFSPNGRQVITASDDKTARIWDAESGRLLTTLQGHTDGLRDASFSPDGTRIVSASDDATAKVWEAATGAVLTTLHHEASVMSAQFSPDGQCIVTASGDATARIWETKTGRLLATLAAHERTVMSAGFSHDGKKIITASTDGTVCIWSAATGQLIRSDRPEPPAELLRADEKVGYLRTAEFSSSGERFLAASSDGYIRILFTNPNDSNSSGSSPIVLRDPSENLWNAKFSPDGRFIISASEDGTAHVWNCQTGELVMTAAGHAGPVWTAEFDPSSKRLLTASSDGTARLWSFTVDHLGTTLTGHQGGVTSAQFSPDDSERVVTASEDKTARVWETSAGRLLFTLDGHRKTINSAEFSPDGERILTASSDTTACVWEATSGKRLATLPHDGDVRSAHFSPDGAKIVTASDDRTARLWETASGKLLNTLQREGRVWSAVFSPDGGRVIVASTDRMSDEDRERVDEDYFSRTTGIWVPENGSRIITLGGGVKVAEFSTDGSRIVAASNRGRQAGEAVVWDAATGKPLSFFRGHEGAVIDAHFSPNGSHVLTVSDDKTARLWDAGSGKLLSILPLDGQTATGRFSPDGEYIVTASGEVAGKAHVCIWQGGNGKRLATLGTHRRPVNGARFSPEGERIVTASWDNTARVWTILPSNAGPPPDWFRDFLHYMAQRRLNSDGELEFIPPNEWLVLRERLRAVARDTTALETPYLRVLRHFVHDEHPDNDPRREP